MTLWAARALVLGLVSLGRFSRRSRMLPKDPIASTSCTLPGAAGSATTVTRSRSGPSAASASSAATLTFWGKPRTASTGPAGEDLAWAVDRREVHPVFDDPGRVGQRPTGAWWWSG